MADLTQVSFLGSSVRNFTTSLGWSGQVSECTISLVDDARNGDKFIPPIPGAPCHFIYGDFRFSGLLQSYKVINEQSGFPIYEVKLVDPRELLEGVQIILNDYNADTSSIPNLYNVYGYYENQRFGSSLINEAGMPWATLLNGLLNLTAITPIQYKNYEFRLSLSSALSSPILPTDYRVKGGGFSMNLMDIISQIAEDSGYDFFFRLENLNGLNYIVLNMASRILVPVMGTISTFISQNTSGQAIRSEYGEEMRNEITSKFLVGGKIARLYLQEPANGDSTIYTDDTIMQYWGNYENGTPVIGQSFDGSPPASGNYQFNLPSRSVNVFGVGDYYPTDVTEMRSALGGQAGWETYLWSKNGDINSPHYTKADRIGIISDLRQNIVDVLKKDYTDETKFRALDLRNFAPLTGKFLKKQGAFIKDTEENAKILFDYVTNFANEYYGKKYMIRVPFLYGAIEPDTSIIRTSLEPCEGGYLSESETAIAIDYGFLPPNTFNLTLEDNRIETYCRFSNAQDLDLSDISPESITIDSKEVQTINDDNTNTTTTVLYAYIKCQVEPKFVYLDNSTLFSPRAIVTLPGRVTSKITDGNDFSGVLRLIFDDHARTNLGMTDKAAIDDVITTIFNRFGGEQLLYGLAGLAITPDLVAVPLQSNIETYGPWYALGAIGKLEAEYDPDLVPWNYNGYTNLNLIANAKVEDSLSYQQNAELGSIEVPGAPTQNLGDQLLDSGPYITNMSVSIGENGVTTTYNMQTWTPRFGRLSKANVDRITRINKVVQNQQKLIQKLSVVPPPGNSFFGVRANALLNKTGRRDPHTSHTFLAGEIFTDVSGYPTANVVSSPTYDLPLTVNNTNYSSKAFTSLDGLFRPFSTNPNVSGIAHFETPDSNATTPNISGLNPFQSGTDVYIFAHGSGLPTDENEFVRDNIDYNNIRSVALRGPLIISGWGFDTGGHPVPNSGNGTDSFATDYLKRSDLWKTGPVDMKWDDSRKIWATGGGTFRAAKLRENLIGGQSASGVFLTPVFATNSNRISSWTEGIELFRIYDGFEYSYPITPSGARVYIQKEETSQQWFTTAAGIF